MRFASRLPLVAPLLLILALGCGSGTGGAASNGTPLPTGPATYVAPPPAGKLPWPHHNPAWTQAEVDKARGELDIINNFGLYQGADDGKGAYLHDGLDFVLPNGTPIYVIQSGRVVYVDGAVPSYKVITVEDGDDPTRAWQYVHIDGFSVRQGDAVWAGQKLAEVRFNGLPHIHLNRLARDPGVQTWQGFEGHHLLWSNDRFELPDTEPPVISSPLRFWNQGAPAPLPAAPEPVLQGRVEILAAVRDGGESSRSHEPPPNAPFGDRNMPTRFLLEIRKPGGPALLTKSFDWSQNWIPSPVSPGMVAAEVALRFIAPPLAMEGAARTNWNKVFS